MNIHMYIYALSLVDLELTSLAAVSCLKDRYLGYDYRMSPLFRAWKAVLFK